MWQESTIIQRREQSLSRKCHTWKDWAGEFAETSTDNVKLSGCTRSHGRLYQHEAFGPSSQEPSHYSRYQKHFFFGSKKSSLPPPRHQRFKNVRECRLHYKKAASTHQHLFCLLGLEMGHARDRARAAAWRPWMTQTSKFLSGQQELERWSLSKRHSQRNEFWSKKMRLNLSFSPGQSAVKREWQWLYFQNVIQLQPHGSKSPIVLEPGNASVAAKVAAWQQAAFCSHLATVQLVRSPPWNMKLSLGLS